MSRLNQLNFHFAAPKSAAKTGPKRPIVDDVWASMDLDQHMSSKAVKLRKATSQMMDSIEKDLLPYSEKAEFPPWLVGKIKELGISGFSVKGYGSPELSTLESGALCFEAARRDASVGTFMIVHVGAGMALIEALGNEEQKQRFLPKGASMEKIYAFALTEPDNGSDASGLKTTARRTEGGWILNGQKRWIGNATMADVIVWARNVDDGGRIQAFVVEKGSPGFDVAKMQGKMSLRMQQNGLITMRDCFVPDHNKLALANDFATGTVRILEASRMLVAWAAVGSAAGAYEAALRYTTQRVQFGKPLAKF